LDPALNERRTGDRTVSPPGTPVSVLALATNEEVIVARRAYKLLTT
jgi:acetate kinase